MKSTTVEEFKELVDGKESAEADVADLETEVSSLNEENSRLQQELNNLKAQLDEAKASTASVVETATESESSSEESMEATSTVSMDGLLFKVQVGAYKGIDLRKYFDNYKNFSGEVGDDGVLKYTLGVFTDYWEADQFKKYLREMGVKDAWVVSYKDGARIPIKDALEGVH